MSQEKFCPTFAIERRHFFVPSAVSRIQSIVLSIFFATRFAVFAPFKAEFPSSTLERWDDDVDVEIETKFLSLLRNEHRRSDILS